MTERFNPSLFDGHRSEGAKGQPAILAVAARPIANDESLPPVNLTFGVGPFSDSYAEALQLGVPDEVVTLRRELERIDDPLRKVGGSHS
jgi:hypothetical protein